MDALSDVLSSKKWDLPTQEPTFAIGLSFIFLAYFLHPRIESAYQRVRASRAWRAVQKHKRVDVTTYPMLSEVFGGRRRLDAPRTITILLAALSLGSWVLELSLKIYHVKGQAYLLTRPPPVYKYFQDPENQSLVWQILPLEDINPEYQGDWQSLNNMRENEAKSRYYVNNYRRYAWSKKIDTYVDGEIVVASWDSDSKPSLSYGSAEAVTVESIACTGDGDPLVDASVSAEQEWGRVLECGEGPKLDTQGGASQPAIILTKSSTGGVHVIVEEVGAHLSFLYSVWAAASVDSADLAYSFHISSTVRLAEAVVTGIVHGETSGGGCFGLVRAFSRGDDTVDTAINYPLDQYQRAKPFGEKPEDGRVDSLQDVETLEAGVLMNTNALVAFVCLLLLSLIGIGWSMCLKSSFDMDVYDRDELLRAISQQAQGEPDDPSKHSAMRIYVQKELSGQLNVVISESDGDESGCVRFLLRRKPTPSVHPVPVADAVRNALDDHGGAPLPQGRPRLYLGGIRTGMGRAYPGRNSNFRYPVSIASSVALTASPVPSNFPTPVPSNVGSATGTPVPSNSGSAIGTPVSPRPPRSSDFLASFGRGGGAGGGGAGGHFAMAGRGPSVLFESVNTMGDDGSSSSGGGGGGGGGREVDTDGSADIEKGSGALARPQAPPAFGGNGTGDIGMGSLELVRPQALMPAFSGDRAGTNTQGGGSSRCCAEALTTGGRRGNNDGSVGGAGGDPLHFPSDQTTPPASPESSPLPPRGSAAELTLSPPELGQVIPGFRRKTLSVERGKASAASER